jgi:hypothetical protein
LESVIDLPLLLLGQADDVDGAQGQCVEQAGVAGRRFGWPAEVAKPAGLRKTSSFLDEDGEAALQAGAPAGVDVGVHVGVMGGLVA